MNDPDEVEPLPSWLTITDWHEATSAMQALTNWLEQVYLRYPDTQLPACWAWHPHVVEELWWLHNAWLDAYTGPAASWSAVAAWHDHHRPGVAHRIAAATGTCGLELHTTEAGDPAPAAPLVDALPLIVTAWTSTSRAAWPPNPNAQLLNDARRHHDELAAHRRRGRPCT